MKSLAKKNLPKNKRLPKSKGLPRKILRTDEEFNEEIFTDEEKMLRLLVKWKQFLGWNYSGIAVE